MKNSSWYLLIILVLTTVPVTQSKGIDGINPVYGFVSYVISDLPASESIEGCKCNGTKVIKSGDGLFSKPCVCKDLCRCPKDKDSLPNLDKITLPPEKIALDCDLPTVRSMLPNEPQLPYKRFKPMSRKEVWVLKVKTKDGQNWCEPCLWLDKEFAEMKKGGWLIDEEGSLENPGKYHIRVIDYDKFEEFPSYFQNTGKTLVINDSTISNESVSLPTVVFLEDYKVKKVYYGFLNMWGIKKLFEGKEPDSSDYSRSK